jgi:hypothetical protein
VQGRTQSIARRADVSLKIEAACRELQATPEIP